MKIRRIVTGHDPSGNAVVWNDDVQSGTATPVDRIKARLVWTTDRTPYDYMGGEDTGMRQLGIAPPAGGTRFSVIEIEPGNSPYMHRTDTIDFVVCLAGEVEMQLTEEKITMRAGDVMVQRGTYHAWCNRGSVPARLAVVLVDGKPKRKGSV